MKKTPSHRASAEARAGDEKIARLRALRLSKEAADREAAEQLAAAQRAEIKSGPRAARDATRSRMPPPRLAKADLRRRLVNLPPSHHIEAVDTWVRLAFVAR